MGFLMDQVSKYHSRLARRHFKAKRRALTEQGLTNLPPAYIREHMGSRAARHEALQHKHETLAARAAGGGAK